MSELTQAFDMLTRGPPAAENLKMRRADDLCSGVQIIVPGENVPRWWWLDDRRFQVPDSIIEACRRHRRLLLPTCATAALALTACGSSYGNGSSSFATPDPGGDTVSTAAAGGIGEILVDSAGEALYTADEEASGTVLCIDKCTSIWVPLAPSVTAPTTSAKGVTVAVIDRPDGTKQITANGRPLYTFSQDTAGKVTGQGLSDDFGSRHFTWHAVLSDGTPASTPGGGTSPSGYGY